MKHIRLAVALITLIATIVVIGSGTIGIADEESGPKCDCQYTDGTKGVQGLNEENEWDCIIVNCWFPIQ